MIPVVHRSGKSFRSAAEYCLGDKVPELKKDEGEERKKPQEGDPSWSKEIMSDRVAWTQTLNLPTDNPYQATRMMAATVGYAPALKQRAGVKEGGRQLEKPVCHYSLSWKEGERPSRPEMIEAVRSSLETLRLEDRQALVVAHCDTRSAHVHVIANRVSWEDGRAANLGRSHRVLSRWAENYERSRREIQCPDRVERNARRADGEIVFAKKTPSKATYYRDPYQDRLGRRRYEDGDTPQEQAEVEKLRAAEQRIFERSRSSNQERREEIDRSHKQQWRELYQQQDKEREQLEVRLEKAPDRERQGYDPKGELEELARRHKQQRGDLGRRHARTRKQLRNLYATEYIQGLATQRGSLSARIESDQAISAAKQAVCTALKNEIGRSGGGGGGGGSPVPPSMKNILKGLGDEEEEHERSWGR